ncbi:MAG: 3-oxoacyl-ACP reductase FabG [Proteobacteria bacterium]|nr:3-oxoacyl-ACP reductase FabG [Pseudomonadota bacterium]
MRLKNKVAIITGAAGGIGLAIATMLSTEGASVVLTDVHKEGAEKGAEEINKSGGKALSIKVDVTSSNEVSEMVEKSIAKFGRVDILVNCHGPQADDYSFKRFHETDLVSWETETDILFIGTLLCCKAVIPKMLEQKKGRIINIGSDSGKHGTAYHSIYSGCKAAVAGFTRAIALELAADGITVNCISPGPVNTPALAKAMAKFSGIQDKYVSAVPLGRLGEPVEIAALVVFLASEDANWITGQDYSVNGGLRM